jgi:LPXTG-motif cell wall-anchored protein
MRMRRSLLRAAAVVASVALMLVGSATSAQAEGSEILVSSDGVNFATEYDGNLLGDIGVLVPRDQATRSVWIRNPTPTPAVMRMSVSDMGVSSPVMASSVLMTTTDVDADTKTERRLDELKRCTIVVPPRVVPANGTIRIDVTITMLDVDQQVSQRGLGWLNFLIAMRDDAAGEFPPSACDDTGVTIPTTPIPTPSGDLVVTGSDMPTEWFVLSGVLIGLGILLLARRRRSARDEA